MILTFVGGGVMATALMGSMMTRGLAAADIRVVEPHADARDRLAAAYPGIVLCEAIGEVALQGTDVVVFAVKPQQMRGAAHALAPFLTGATKPVLLTIAAGIRLADLSRWLGGYARLVRAMPNTPALIGKGISGAFALQTVDGTGRAFVAEVLESAGQLLWVATEPDLDAVTAVSGSGPAYVYYFLEALEESARALGFSRAEARQLAHATFDGAVALAERSPLEPAVLRAQVTTKGGTTERALAMMEAAAVKSTIVAAVAAACERAHELGDAFGSDT